MSFKQPSRYYERVRSSTEALFRLDSMLSCIELDGHLQTLGGAVASIFNQGLSDPFFGAGPSFEFKEVLKVVACSLSFLISRCRVERKKRF